ncbi:MAG TPA: LiaF domain-containing protein [Euzebyales bacterium]
MSTAPAPVPIPDRQEPAWGRLLWGVVLVGAGVLWLLDAADVVDVTFPRMIALALIGVGIVTPFVPVREHGGVIGLGIVLVVLALITVVAGPAADVTVFRSGAGNVTLAPASASQVRETYEHGAGNVTVDLRDITFPVGTTATAVRLGAGELTIRVPDDVSVQVDASAGMGEVVVDEQERAGVAPSFSGELAGTSSSRVLSLDVSVGVGRIEVTR